MDENQLKLMREACAWLRSINRDRQGETIAAELEAAFPEVEDAMAEAHPQFVSRRERVEPQPVEPEPEPE